MGKLLEVIRRLAIVIIWALGGLFTVVMVGEGWKSKDDTQVAFGLGILVATFIVHKIVNWILLKDEKNAPPGNQ